VDQDRGLFYKLFETIFVK